MLTFKEVIRVLAGARDDGQYWLIWSYEHDRWWAPGGRGYVDSIAEAGRWPYIEATIIVQEANRFTSPPNEDLVHISRLYKFVGDTWARRARGLSL